MDTKYIVDELKLLSKDLRLLYVDSNEESTNKMLQFFNEVFTNVSYLSKGDEALEKYKQGNIDLVITAINIPNINGLDLIYEIKNINPNQIVCIVSVHTEVDYFISSIKLGVDGYIIKPINFKDLCGLLLKVSKKIIEAKKYKKIQDKLESKNIELSYYTNALNKVAIVSKTDLRGYITFANDIFCEVSGYTREELIGKNHNIVRHPDVSKEVYKQMWDTIKSGKTWEGDVKNLAKTGEPYYVHAVISPIFSDDNITIKEYIGIRFLTTDNEEKRRKFKKQVITNFNEFKKRNKKLKDKIAELENDLSINDSLNDKEKMYNKILTKIKENNNELLSLYKKSKCSIESKNVKIKAIKQNNDYLLKEIEILKKDLEDKNAEIMKLKLNKNKKSFNSQIEKADQKWHNY